MLRSQTFIATGALWLCLSALQTCLADEPVDDFTLTGFPDSVSGDVSEEIADLRRQLQQAQTQLDWYHEASGIQQASFQQAQTQSSAASDDGGGALAKKSQNPVSDLVSLPFQSNFDFGNSPGNRVRFVGNLQPVIPVKLNEDWNLINRIIIPFVNAPIGADQRSDGIGDAIGQFFISPRNSESIIWGVGPVFQFPTASDSTLGFQEWGAGITAVGLISEGPIVAGSLIHQIWSTEGSTKPFLIQPFLNYNLPKGWYLLAAGEFNADWERPDGRRWTSVFGPGVGRVAPILGQPMNINARFAPYLDRPAGGPDWQFRFQVTWLFPK